MGKIIGGELTDKIMQNLEHVPTLILATVDEDGWPHTAPMSWIKVKDRRTLSMAIHRDIASLRNIRRSGKVRLVAMGRGMAISIRGFAKIVKEEMESSPFPAAVVEVTVDEIKDDLAVGRPEQAEPPMKWGDQVITKAYPHVKTELSILQIKVADIMSSPVITVGPDCSVGQLAVLLNKYGISGVPVVDQSGKILGIATEHDVLTHADEDKDTVGHIMTTHVITTSPDIAAVEAGRLMVANRIRRLPVVHEGRLVGIVTRGDIVRALGEQWEQQE
jgi:CBS domain-containing protein